MKVLPDLKGLSNLQDRVVVHFVKSQSTESDINVVRSHHKLRV